LKQLCSMMVFMAAVVLATGCSGWKDSRAVQAPRQLYKGYINIDPSIDLSNPGVGNKGQEELAFLFAGMDQKLLELTRQLDGRDTLPSEQWFDQMMRRFDWLSGMGAVDSQGAVLTRKPESGMKVPDYDVLLHDNVLYGDRALRAGVEQNPLGPEVYVGTPFYEDTSWLGLLVAHFDFRSLVRYSPDPDRLMILYEGGVLWPGTGFDQEGLLAIDWSTLLRRNIQGTLRLEKDEYYWMSRYIGQLRLIYLVRTS
jgi:hypothetical protein